MVPNIRAESKILPCFRTIGNIQAARGDNGCIEWNLCAIQMSFAVIPLSWVCIIPPVSPPHAWEKELPAAGAAAAAAAVGAARITKVKDYLHMVFLSRKREVL